MQEVNKQWLRRESGIILSSCCVAKDLGTALACECPVCERGNRAQAHGRLRCDGTNDSSTARLPVHSVQYTFWIVLHAVILQDMLPPQWPERHNINPTALLTTSRLRPEPRPHRSSPRPNAPHLTHQVPSYPLPPALYLPPKQPSV